MTPPPQLPRDRLPRRTYDAVVIGSGPNGLAAAITLARAGRSVVVLEAEPTAGGGTRSAELTLPGFVHDVCSAIHPLGVGSAFFRSVPLADHGLDWIHPAAPLAHPLDDGTAAILERSVEATAQGLGPDAVAYQRLMGPLVRSGVPLMDELLGPLRPPRHPLLMLRFGLRAIRSARGLADAWFKGPHARGLFAGIAAHSILPLEKMLTSAVGLMLGLAAHAVGWPLPRGGSQKISDALVSYLRSLGGEVVTGWRVESLAELPKARAFLFDVSPRNLARICGKRLPARYRRQLERFRHGPAVFKLDWALDGPIPWKAASCARAATVHLGGTFEEIADAERAVWKGEHPQRPYVLVAQQSLFDPTRAPAGKHTGWGYCHVPNGSTVDMTEAIEGQMERFAPGFRDRILARSVWRPVDFERRNANYIGGDITGGVMDLWQIFTRPAPRLVPYTTPASNVFLCSASTPPGPGVHGMCGYFAARAALRTVLA
ncbi:MAG: NAD(P)/FAD-dependent oxidoreductase [Planctomycetes bacterium]|nr:NAD(P)/FAD-dependent oxidoreductase [Planctomycetota bacterium]